MKDAFSGYHPAVNFCYFVLVIGFSMFLMHPVCLILSLICALTYALLLNGRRAMRLTLCGLLPLLVLTTILNPLFSHEGATILTYLPDGNPLTAESVWYGLAAACMMVSVILWFSCYHKVMTSDKFLYLFGRVIPVLSLIFSMTLRFVPRFTEQFRVVASAQRCIGRDLLSGSLARRLRNGISVLSVMLTWALESAVITADSMKSRGYGLKGRTAFSRYRLEWRDVRILLFLLLTAGYLVVCIAMDVLSWQYYPLFHGSLIGVWQASAYLAYTALCLMPAIMRWREDRKWHVLKSGL